MRLDLQHALSGRSVPKPHPVLLTVVLLLISWALSKVCICEVGGLFLAQALLILCWCIAQRPRICVSWLYLVFCGILLIRETILAVSLLVTPIDAVPSHKGGLTRFISTAESAQVSTFWFVSALACVWTSLYLSLRQVNRWHALPTWFGGRLVGYKPVAAERPGATGDVAQYVAVILAVPATYGVCSVRALRILISDHEAWSAEAMLDLAELFSAVALFAFQRLLVCYVGAAAPAPLESGVHSMSTTAATSPSIASEGWHHTTHLRRSFQELMAAGIMQYVVLVFGSNLIEVAAKTWDSVHPKTCDIALLWIANVLFPHHKLDLRTVNGNSPSTCEDLWNAVSWCIVVANFFTCSIAIFAIFKYERAFADLLHSVQPFWKFWGVKGLLSVNFAQSLILKGLCVLGGPEVYHYCLIAKFWLLCVESLLLAGLNVFAYDPPKVSFARSWASARAGRLSSSFIHSRDVSSGIGLQGKLRVLWSAKPKIGSFDESDDTSCGSPRRPETPFRDSLNPRLAKIDDP